jgi:small redox-active disulfide protein 2
MKTIKILGSGCPKCLKTTDIVEKAVKATGTAAKIEKEEEFAEIMKYNVMSTPALVIDEEVVMTGRVPKQKDVETLLKA